MYQRHSFSVLWHLSFLQDFYAKRQYMQNAGHFKATTSTAVADERQKRVPPTPFPQGVGRRALQKHH